MCARVGDVWRPSVPLVEEDLLQRGHVDGRHGNLDTVEVDVQLVAHPPQRRLLVDLVPHLQLLERCEVVLLELQADDAPLVRVPVAKGRRAAQSGLDQASLRASAAQGMHSREGAAAERAAGRDRVTETHPEIQYWACICTRTSRSCTRPWRTCRRGAPRGVWGATTGV